MCCPQVHYRHGRVPYTTVARWREFELKFKFNLSVNTNTNTDTNPNRNTKP